MTAKTTSKNQHHFAHDQGLLRILILCWLASILAGLALHKILEFFPDHKISSLLPTFSFSSTSGEGSDASWKHVEFHGDVELLRRPIALVLEEYSPFFSTKATGLYAYRAVSTVDLPMEALLHVFRDTPKNVRSCRVTVVCKARSIRSVLISLIAIIHHDHSRLIG